MQISAEAETLKTPAVHNAHGRPSLLANGMSAVFYAWKLGWRLLISGQVRNGIKQILYPVGYWRFWVHAALIREYRQIKPINVLDISSPKLPSLYFADCGSRVVATDFQGDAIFGRWSRAASLCGYDYKVCLADARQLDFPASSFDFLYSLSVVEHIPDGGDSQAINEFARVLRDGGVMVVQVPIRHAAQDCYRCETSDGQPTAEAVWYERFYSNKTMSRLAHPQLQNQRALYTSERIPIDPLINRLPKKLRLLVAPIEWILALLNVRVSNSLEARPLGVMLISTKVAEAQGQESPVSPN